MRSRGVNKPNFIILYVKTLFNMSTNMADDLIMPDCIAPNINLTL